MVLAFILLNCLWHSVVMTNRKQPPNGSQNHKNAKTKKKITLRMLWKKFLNSFVKANNMINTDIIVYNQRLIKKNTINSIEKKSSM